MPSVVLLWYSINDDVMTASRSEAAALAEELALPPSIVSATDTPTYFTWQCQHIEVSYPGAGSEPMRQASAHEVRKTPDVLTYEVRRTDSRKVRLAQIKYFRARRTEHGVVPGSARVTVQVSNKLDAFDAAGAQRWIAEFNQAWNQGSQPVSSKTVRRLAMTAMQSIALPLVTRKWLYFTYPDRLDTAWRLQTFLRRVSAGGDVVCLPLDDSADLTLFRETADHHCSMAVSDFNARFSDVLTGRRVRDQKTVRELAEQFEQHTMRAREHEKRLSCQLTETRACLEQSKRLMMAADPSGNLLRVSEQ
jgi:hypothetical protein